jgi:DNA primase
VRQAIVDSGQGAVLERLESGVRGRREWWTDAGTAVTDAETGFRHALALHVKVSALHNELRSAEAALGQEPSEDNFRRVVEVQRGLRAVEGSEAAIEGFGGASGRPARSL